MSESEPTAPAPEGEPVPCPPCRGTGRVSSGLGGTTTELTCPWCEGDGRLRRDHDAQEAGERLRRAAG